MLGKVSRKPSEMLAREMENSVRFGKTEEGDVGCWRTFLDP